MKKIVKSILTAVCVATLALGAFGCNEKVVNAYDIAVKNGFKGDEAAWLRSLQGIDGDDVENLTAQQLYDTALANGYEGSFLDFCKTLNITLPQKNDTATIAQNMLSTVSIYCNYAKTTLVSNGYIAPPSKYVEYGASAGSGVIIDLDEENGTAIIVTNYHVVYNKDCDDNGILSNIWIYPYGADILFSKEKGDVGGDGMKATYLGGAMDYDIALLQIDASEYMQDNPLREARWGDSDEVTLGEETYVIGNPAGQGLAVTNGIISVTSEYINISALDSDDENDVVSYRVIRTSAAINGGNSGGGMYNAAGELIGIVNAKNAASTTDNMGYALPSSQVEAICKNIRLNGKVRKATLGVTVFVKDTKAVVGADGNVRIEEVFEIKSVEKGGAAYGKFSTGDIFLSASVNGGETVVFKQEHQLLDLLLSVKEGDRVAFTVLNGSGQQRTVEIAFGANDFVEYE